MDYKIKNFLQKIRESNKNIKIFSIDGCPACEEFKNKLSFLNINYHIMDMVKNPELWDDIKNLGGGDYVPQILVNDVLIYEYNDINELLSKVFTEILGKKVIIK
jgi:glutaredoxin